MDFKFSKDSEESPNKAVDAGKGKSQNALLLLLLVLVGGFAYMYFFTGLIKPLDAQKPAAVPVPQVVKAPLPSRNGEPVKAGETAVPETGKEAAAPSASVKPEPAKVAQPSPAVAPVAKETSKPREEAVKPAPSAPAPKKPLSAPVAKQEQKPVVAKVDGKKTAAVEKKPQATAEKKAAAAKQATGKEKATGVEAKTGKMAAAKSGKKPAPGTGRASSNRWTVMVGSYKLEDTMAVDLARVRKAGLEAVVLPGERKQTQMNRLLLGEYNDRSTAQSELDKIRRHTSDAFIMNQGGTHAVYAGSYLLRERAVSEKERLAAAGFALTLKRVEVAIPSKMLTAGTFSDKKDAESALKKLRAAGVKASISRQ